MLGLTEDEIRQAIDKLLQRTDRGAAIWSPWQQSEEYWTETPKFKFFIKSRDEDDNPPYVLEIWRKAEDGSGSAIKVAQIVTGATPSLNANLTSLYMNVKLAAHGLKDLGADLLGDLD